MRSKAPHNEMKIKVKYCKISNLELNSKILLHTII